MQQLSPGHPENNRLRTMVVAFGIATGAQWDRAEESFAAKAAREKRFIEALGGIPETIREYIAMSAARYGWQVRYRGEIAKPDGSWIHAGEISTCLILDADEMGLPFKDSKIVRAVDAWIAAEKQVRFCLIRDTVAKLPDGRCRHAVMQELEEGCRAYFSTDPAYAVAAITKLIWQVKRKMVEADIPNVHMLVMTGDQGCGKSYLADAMCGPVDELKADVAFDELTDNRNISLWNNYILNTDELVRAAQSDTTAMKNAITGKRADKRLLGTNTMAAVKLRATIIGTSNKPVAEVIVDPTGMRRFLELNVKKKDTSNIANWRHMMELDWLAIWQAVDAAEEDPMHAFKAQVEEAQEAMRARSRVEEFLDAFEIADVDHSCRYYREDAQFTSTKLFEVFSAWEVINYPGNRTRTSHARFGRDMKTAVAGAGHPKWSVRMAQKKSFFDYER